VYLFVFVCICLCLFVFVSAFVYVCKEDNKEDLKLTRYGTLIVSRKALGSEIRGKR